MPSICKLEGCGRGTAREGLCIGHLRRAQGLIPADRPIETRVPQVRACRIEGCSGTTQAKGFCHMHYQRKLRELDLFMPKRPAKLEAMRKITVLLPGYAADAVLRRCTSRHMRASALLRALVEKWAMTDGAATRQEHDLHEEEAWKRSDYDLRGET